MFPCSVVHSSNPLSSFQFWYNRANRAVHLNIFTFLYVDEMFGVSRVNRYWYNLTLDPLVWNYELIQDRMGTFRWKGIQVCEEIDEKSH